MYRYIPKSAHVSKRHEVIPLPQKSDRPTPRAGVYVSVSTAIRRSPRASTTAYSDVTDRTLHGQWRWRSRLSPFSLTFWPMDQPKAPVAGER
jgi:hypothetical protein